MPEERRQNLAETDRESFYNQEEQVEEFLDDKDAFYNGSESDDDDNDDGNYNENGSIRSQMFFKTGVLKNSANFTGKDLCWSFFLRKLQAQRPVTLFKKVSNTGGCSIITSRIGGGGVPAFFVMFRD